MKISVRYLLATLIVSGGVLGFATEKGEAFSEQVIQHGATGDDVVELQARLQYIGYFDNTIDGVYGWGTYWSVREYQEAFGMEVNGLVGDETKQRLYETTEYDEAYVQNALRSDDAFTHYGPNPRDGEEQPEGEAEEQPAPEGGEEQAEEEAPAPEEGEEAPAEEGEQPETGGEQPEEEQDNQADIGEAMNVPDGYSDNDIQIMANAVYGEGRGEPYEGMVAIAAVIINRTDDPEFPDTANEVIFEPLAFEAVADGQIYLEPNEEARQAVLDAVNGQDPSNGASYFYNPETAESDWIYTRDVHTEIGQHVFAD